MKFHFIAAHRHEFRLRILCHVLGVSASGFYQWARRPAPRHAERNDALLVHIQTAYTASRRTYGAPRIHRELHARGVAAGRHRIARLMRREGIVACTERRFRWTATARAELPAAPDRLRRDFTAAAPNQRWVSDITSVRTGQGWLHLAIVLDLYARRIVGWAMAPTLDQHLAHEALAMALTDRRPAPGLLFHFRSGRAVSLASGSAARPPRGPRPQHQPAWPLCRQRGGGELLPHPENRTGLPAPLSDARGGALGNLRVPRRLLQSHPAALGQRVSLTRRAGSAVRCQCHLTTCHFSGATSVGCMRGLGGSGRSTRLTTAVTATQR